MEAGKAMLH